MTSSDSPARTTAADWIARDAAVVWHGFTQMATYGANAPIVVTAGEGRELIDVDGRRYLDAISSLWVTTLGHRVPELDQALIEQVGRIAHSTMLGNGNQVVVELSEALARVAPVDTAHILYASDGAAAVEQALKIAFQFWWNQGERGRDAYLALGDAYHGDTVGSLSLGAGGFGTELFDALRFPVVRTPGYADPAWLPKALEALRAHADRLAAVVIEPLVQGAAGIRTAEAADVADFARACQAAGVLLVCDEVATGFGRTGTLFASEQCGVRPDVLCLGKGITGGYLPMSATVASGRVFDAFLGDDLGPRTFYHGHSYGGNALAAAVASRHLQLLEEWEVLANVRIRAAELATGLAGLQAEAPTALAVRQHGLMIGVEMTCAPAAGRWGRRVCAAAVDQGVLLRPLGDVIVIMPPLTITACEVERIVDVLGAALRTVAG